MADSIKVEGDERLRVTLAAAAADIADLEAPLGKSARRAATRAAQMAPKVTGRLAGSVHVSFVTPTETAIGSPLPYAGPAEYGWPSQHRLAKPFLRPGVDQTAKDTVADLTGHAQHALEQVKGA